MVYNEQNTVEHFIIHQITRANLNVAQVNRAKEDKVKYEGGVK
jgi:hypothetical protein